jgi:branched-chain amino acid transport system ATP-binding protein
VALLDEPGAGVPPADAGLIERALAQLPAALAVLLIEHDMEFVFRFARRVIVMVGGAIVFSGTPAEAAASPVVRAAYLGGPADAGSGA